MSFLRHQEIFPSDGGASPAANASAHRLDEFPAGYSSAGCSPALPASASLAGHQYAVLLSCRSRIFHPTANSVLTVCLSPGGQRMPNLNRRLRKLEALMTDDAGLVPGSPKWLAYWTERADKILQGDDEVRGCQIPFEVLDAILERARASRRARNGVEGLSGPPPIS